MDHELYSTSTAPILVARLWLDNACCVNYQIKTKPKWFVAKTPLKQFEKGQNG